MSPNKDAHHLQVQHNKSQGLSYQVPMPVQRCFCKQRRIRFVVISSNTIFFSISFSFYHSFIQESTTRRDGLSLCAETGSAGTISFNGE